MDFVEPGHRQELRLASKKERLQRPGFATGVDLFTEVKRRVGSRVPTIAKLAMRGFPSMPARPCPASTALPMQQEEIAKREQRAGRFGMSDTGLKWEPPAKDEAEEKRAQRAARFGTEYKPADALMDVGGYGRQGGVPCQPWAGMCAWTCSHSSMRSPCLCGSE